MKEPASKLKFDGSKTAQIAIARLFERGNPSGDQRRLARVAGSASGESPSIALIRRFLNPLIAALSLLFCTLLYQADFTDYLLLAILTFLISTQVLSEVQIPVARTESMVAARRLRRLFGEWAVVAGILLLIAFATKLSAEFSRKLILTWFCVTPFLMIAAQAGVRRLLPSLVASAGQLKSALVVGATPLSVEFARRVDRDPNSVKVLGFFDDRALERLPSEMNKRFLGRLQDLPDYVRNNPVGRIYISLPIAATQRILKLLDDLGDSTASVYFVPDLYAFGLIQARLDEVVGIPVVAVRESPFCGLDGAHKRSFDVVLASLILLMIWPILLALALGVKLTSSGPVFFKQRRYGLDGKKIVVYKFRSMRVCEDGSEIRQATLNDSRATALGRFM
ncbi:MAG: sugar transferase, partial [Pyrinomonadaceae bacterium]